MSALRYRADIDGLRSIAVLPVVAFHFGIAAAPGGFVGVDVFFVISGYLITSIIARECAEGRFSLLDFYERRARRILPALFAMIAAVVVIGWFLFLPREFFDLAKSVGAATVFLANVLFYLSAGYFDAASYTKPLLHTWSLGIEEQFYIVIPLLFMALAWMGWKATAWIAAITVASLALSVATTEAMPQAAYYLLPWRAWELGLGALLALGVAPPLRTAAAREAAAAIGVVLILGAVVLLDKSVPFPGWAALAPCLGAALLIHAGAGGTTRVGAVLASAVPVWIGKLSYSLYLWHWPVVVFFVYREMRMPTLVEAAVLFAVSLALAFASLKLVE
ncbi:MAG: acyltransferase, partial [Pseudomonadota bacterium]